VSAPVPPEGAVPVKRIADAHHHLWDLSRNRYPWLQGDPQDPADPSGIGMLQRDYLVDDLRADTAGLGLRCSVHVEAAHDKADPVRETAWLQDVRASDGLPTVIVAAAELERPDVADVLAAHAEYPAVRGIRQMLDLYPGANDPAVPGLLSDRSWRRGLGLLAPLNLVFDLQVLPVQLPAAAEVVGAFDETVFILNHGGYHVPRSAGQEEAWRHGIRLLARHPNVAVKVSGYDVVDPTWEPGGYATYVTTLLDTFGVERVLFGSNFPVDRRTISYAGLVTATAAALQGLGEGERDSVFFRNATRYYRIEPAGVTNGPADSDQRHA
jgi:predicted TIM-barrel fold metal-dependent hydrolase